MLLKKTYRAIWRNKKAYLACVFLIMIGSMMLTTMGTAVTGLNKAIDHFYANYRLAHVWANVGGIPISEVEWLRNIPGVFDVSHRTSMELRAEVAGSDDIIILRLLSFNPQEENRINDFLLSGIGPSLHSDIALSLLFMDARNLEIGNQITIYAQGRAFTYEVTGSFMSPEYAYVARGGGEMLPAHSVFGIAYITEEGIDKLTGRNGVANEVLFTLAEGYEFEDVRTAIAEALSPYELLSVLDRNAQMSFAMIDMEVNAIESVSKTMPMVFIFMAAVVLFLMLKRIIEQERTQIGTLKAFGYSNRDMLFHYMTYGGITGLAGGVLGFISGSSVAPVYLQLFLEFFTVPEMTQSVDPIYGVASIAVGIGGGLTGAFAGALGALRLNPAEAMRPESPKAIKFDIVGKFKVLKHILTSRGQMALRNVVRSSIRSGFIVIGIMFSFTLLCVFGDMEGMVDAILYQQFKDVRLYNTRVSLTQPMAYNQAIESAYAISHVNHAEGLWELPVTLINRHLREDTLITGIASDGELYKVFDSRTRTAYPPPADGLIITNGLADKIQAKAGDILYISTNLSRDEIPVPVKMVIEQNIGSGAFMELSALADLLWHPAAVSAILLKTDNLPYVTDRFTESPIVGAVESKDATLKQYIDMMAPFSFIYTVMFFMGVAVAFAIIYNISTISLSERQREFATLRVLGLTVDEVCEIMRIEYRVLAAVGILLGIPAAGGLISAMNMILDNSMMSLPSLLSSMAYVKAAFGTALAIFLSNCFAKRKIRTFNMVEVLKERE